MLWGAELHLNMLTFPRHQELVWIIGINIHYILTTSCFWRLLSSCVHMEFNTNLFRRLTWSKPTLQLVSIYTEAYKNTHQHFVLARRNKPLQQTVTKHRKNICVNISVIKPWLKMIPVNWYDIISLHGLNCPIDSNNLVGPIRLHVIF